MPLLLLMSFCPLVFVGFSGPLSEMVKGIVFRASYALAGPTDFTQTWVSHRKWKFREDDSVQIHSPDTRLDEEAQFQLEIARHRKIMTHHYLDTTIDEEIQDKARPWDRDAPTMDATRKPHDKLQTRTRRS
ncbi:hypothetical protein BHE74_00035096 [Ensete ventricosum]|nr:hypothetical protein BHE74_00035096 [Ensete ventricosum]